jgi:hypothetical protein
MRTPLNPSDKAGTGQAPLTVPAVPVGLLGAAQERVAPEPDGPAPDRRLAELNEHLAEIRRRAAGATSWLESSEHYARLLNAEGFVPVTARFDARDLMFLGRAREDLLAFAELGARVAAGPAATRPIPSCAAVTACGAGPARRSGCSSSSWATAARRREPSSGNGGPR